MAVLPADTPAKATPFFFFGASVVRFWSVVVFITFSNILKIKEMMVSARREVRKNRR
jgi:hypothetical protein